MKSSSSSIANSNQKFSYHFLIFLHTISNEINHKNNRAIVLQWICIFYSIISFRHEFMVIFCHKRIKQKDCSWVFFFVPCVFIYWCPILSQNRTCLDYMKCQFWFSFVNKPNNNILLMFEFINAVFLPWLCIGRPYRSQHFIEQNIYD